MKIFPTPYIVRALLESGLVGTRVSTRWQGAADQVPAITVTLTGDQSPLDDWTTATAQLDVWAATEDEAGTLAFQIADHWMNRLPGSLDDAHVVGYWVEQSPRPFEDETASARYLMEVGLTLCKENPDG